MLSIKKHFRLIFSYHLLFFRRPCPIFPSLLIKNWSKFLLYQSFSWSFWLCLLKRSFQPFISYRFRSIGQLGPWFISTHLMLFLVLFLLLRASLLYVLIEHVLASRFLIFSDIRILRNTTPWYRRRQRRRYGSFCCWTILIVRNRAG